MNYKKGLLSLATILALSGITSADTNTRYVPLTTAANDGSWVLFGVNGFSTGVASSIGVTATDFSANFTEIDETDTQDNLAEEGLYVGGVTTAPLGWVQTVDDADMVTLKVGVDITGVLYEELEPVRTMYIKVNKSTPNVKFDYKASLEGKTLEILANSVLYSVTIIQDSTYSGAITAVESQTVASTDPVMTSIADVIDYDLKDNPTETKYYSKSQHLDADANLSAAAATSQLYHFDSVSQQWKIWNTNYAGAANDFTTLAKGDAYWGRIDVDDAVTALNNDGNGGGITASDGLAAERAGIILGASGNSAPTADTYKYDDNSSKLAPGWNMIALDDTQEYVRNAATGLIITRVAASAGNMTITDSTGVHSVVAALAGVSIAADAAIINLAIETAKLNGTVPTSFNVKAFGANTVAAPLQIVLISDAKFTIADGVGAGNISLVTTLTGDNPYNELGYNTTIYADLNSATAGQQTATSAYGEYAVIIDVLAASLSGSVSMADQDNGANSTGANVSAKIAFGTRDNDYTPIALTNAADAAPTIPLMKGQIEGHALFDSGTAPTTAYGLATPIDSDDSTAVDKMLVASTVPFYVKDATYTRVFTYNPIGNAAKTFEVIGGATNATITPANPGTATNVAVLIDTQADVSGAGTGVYAFQDAAGTPTKIVVASTLSSTFDLKDLESGTEGFLLNTTLDEDIAKGAVKGVYSLDYVAKLPLIQHSWSATGFSLVALVDNANDTIAFELSPGLTAATPIVPQPALIADLTLTAERLIWFNNIVADLNLQIKTDGLHGYAYHDYTEAADNLGTAKVYVVGMGVTNIVVAVLNDMVAPTTAMADANAAIDGTLGAGLTDGGNLVKDLKSNVVYTPDFASFGPLYTMRDAGYDVRAVLKATTKVSDMSVTWDSIDLTRDESDWFTNNEFNLFSANLDAGYWVFLEENNAASGIAMSAASFTPTYTYYFDNEDADGIFPTSNMINGGQFTVTITGLDGTTSNAYATVGGEEVQLKNTLYTNDYTATFSKYSLLSFSESGEPISVSVRATNGKGAAEVMAVDYSFDYAKPVLSAVASIDLTTVKFTSDDNTTANFYLFKDYIQEVDTARDGASTTQISSYAAAAGVTSQNICEKLTYGDVDTLRVVGVDGTGTFGTANVSDAQEFIYATTLKGAHILSHLGGGVDDKAIIGTTYDTTCTLSAVQPSVATDNSGVSLKALVAGQTALISYEEIDGVATTLSGAWVTTYAVDGTNAIQVQNLSEYAGKPFFLEYGGKMYKTAFPANEAASLATVATPIDLTAVEQISPINATLQP